MKKLSFIFVGNSFFGEGFPIVATSISLSSITGLWLKNVDLTAKGHRDLVENASALLSRLTSLTLLSCKMEDNGLVSLLKQCSNLECLELDVLEEWDRYLLLVKDEDVQELMSAMANVKKFELSYRRFAICQEEFNSFVHCLPNINSLAVMNWQSNNMDLEDGDEENVLLYPTVIKFVSDRAEKIKSLEILLPSFGDLDEFAELANVPGLSLEELKIFVTGNQCKSLERFLISQKNLKKIDFKSFPWGSHPIPNDCSIFKAMANIRHLTISCLQYLEGTSTKGLSYLNQLEHLHVSSNLTDWAKLKDGIENSPFRYALRTLRMVDVHLDYKSSMDFTTYLPNLEHLTIISGGLTNCAVKEIFLTQLKRLKVLDLARCKIASGTDMPESNTDEERKIAEFKKKNLFSMASLCDESMTDVIESISTFIDQLQCESDREQSSLENLILNYAHMNDSIVLWTLNLRWLREINLSGCENISDFGFIALGLNCPRLEVVVLQGCPISDFGLFGMLKSTKRIAKLFLTNCQKVSPDIISKLPTLCPYLRWLSIPYYKLNLGVLEQLRDPLERAGLSNIVYS